ncbi:hypothetical protein [Mycoplasma sp. 3686d]|uniref:hypothetical protein n=1 Tax=Mycoplasma sp. 3686d TaxID=2967300 RepID=UPI00211CDD9C|nr:hypothetical protein [Mycoplasma sp. 3686d]UUM24553.1 hypothetical protein NPA12_02525 [Mycoplasma sp. 3686d]
MFTITEDIQENIELLEDKYNFKTQEFVDKINQHIQTLSANEIGEYLYLITKVFSYNQSDEDRREDILFLISQILNLNPDIKLLKEIDGVLEEKFHIDFDFQYINHYLEHNFVRTGEEWDWMLNDILKQDGIKTSSKEIEEIREMDMETYYQYKSDVGYESISQEDMIEQILTSILLVQKANKGENFLILNNCGKENLKYLQDQGVDIDELIEDFIDESQSLETLEDTISYLTKVNKLFNTCHYQEQILNILTQKHSQNDIDNLNGLLEKNEYFLEKIYEQLLEDSDIDFLKGSTIREKLDSDLKANGTNSEYYLEEYNTAVDIIENIKEDKWYWVDDYGYPYEEISKNVLVEELLYYLKN